MKRYIYLVKYDDGKQFAYTMIAKDEETANGNIYKELNSLGAGFNSLELLAVCDSVINIM